MPITPANMEAESKTWALSAATKAELGAEKVRLTTEGSDYVEFEGMDAMNGDESIGRCWGRVYFAQRKSRLGLHVVQRSKCHQGA